MADWKPQLSYNYNTSYHAYAYGIMYPTGPEQNHHANQSGWAEHGVNDYGNYNAGTSQTYYGTRTREESPPHSPEQISMNNQVHYQGSGVVYLANAPNDRLFLPGQDSAQYDNSTFVNESDRARSDTPTSDSEAHTSPDSWSSGSSREGSLPQTDPASWTKKELGNETDSVSLDVPSVAEDRQTFVVSENEAMAQIPTHAPPSTPKKPSTAVHIPKGKVRTAFSESQMNTLSQRFNIQRYLTPSEMRNLSSSTGLTYKQVKTWFQNRRMKLRKHQKETTWVSKHHTNKDRANLPKPNGAVYANVPPHVQAYQGDARAHIQEQYNQQMREAATFKKSPPQNLAYYLAALGAAGSAAYPSWSPSSHQAAMVNNWPVPPAAAHYNYSPNTFSTASAAPAVDASGMDASVNGKDQVHVVRSPLPAAVVQNGSQ